jgi:hypothetical protein
MLTTLLNGLLAIGLLLHIRFGSALSTLDVGWIYANTCPGVCLYVV